MTLFDAVSAAVGLSLDEKKAIGSALLHAEFTLRGDYGAELAKDFVLIHGSEVCKTITAKGEKEPQEPSINCILCGLPAHDGFCIENPCLKKRGKT